MLQFDLSIVFAICRVGGALAEPTSLIHWIHYMPHYLRNYVKGGTFFFTVVTYMRRPILDKIAISLLEQEFNACNSLKPFRVEAIVILPDHLHCIWTLPSMDYDYSARWRIIKGSFTKEYMSREDGWSAQLATSMQKKGEKGIWQRRFWEHTIRDEKDYQLHFDYIHFNPVRHGLVRAPQDWPHSSFHRWVEEGIYPKSWGGPPGDFTTDVGRE